MKPAPTTLFLVPAGFVLAAAVLTPLLAYAHKAHTEKAAPATTPAQAAPAAEDIEEIEDVTLDPGFKAQGGAKAAKPAAEDIEEIKEPTAVPAAKGATGAAKPAEASHGEHHPGEHHPSAAEYFGRFHPALVHMPIGWFVLTLLLELLALALRRNDFSTAAFATHGLTLAAAVPAIASGLLLYSYGPDGDADIERHRNLMFIMAGVAAVALGLRWWRRSRWETGGAVRYAYLALTALAVLIMAYAGHLGGVIVHGEDYFPF